MDDRDNHTHEWSFAYGLFRCGECPTYLAPEDVARRLNFWINLENEDWKERTMKAKERLEAADGSS